MSDESDVADDAARDGGGTEGSRGSGRTAVAVETALRPQRPTGKRSRRRIEEGDESSVADESAAAGKGQKGRQGKAIAKAEKTKRPKKPGNSASPFMFVYNYLKQVVAEMRKVIWPNRKQMLTYTSVVLAFLAFMVALVGLADFGLTKLVLLVFG
ncbi:MAG: preprotein translocase subunit SecE [Mycobacterium sp.]|nr:preprotein translocase subunit SecE [Mycobacterium sp.]